MESQTSKKAWELDYTEEMEPEAKDLVKEPEAKDSVKGIEHPRLYVEIWDLRHLQSELAVCFCVGLHAILAGISLGLTVSAFLPCLTPPSPEKHTSPGTRRTELYCDNKTRSESAPFSEQPTDLQGDVNVHSILQTNAQFRIGANKKVASRFVQI